jgi:hypothetical protein
VSTQNTKVDMRFDVLGADFLPDWVKVCPPPPPFRSCAGGVLPEGYALPRLS